MARLCAAQGVTLNPDIASVAEPEVLLLAVKPQTLDAAAETATRIAGPGTLVVSILAGKTIATLQDRLPRARAVIRTIPNTPAAVGRGITAATASPTPRWPTAQWPTPCSPPSGRLYGWKMKR